MSVTVDSPKTPVTPGSHGVAAATVPNVCKMPGPPATVHAFTLGGKSAGSLRRMLGELATRSGLALDVMEWNPPLASRASRR